MKHTTATSPILEKKSDKRTLNKDISPLSTCEFVCNNKIISMLTIRKSSKLELRCLFIPFECFPMSKFLICQCFKLLLTFPMAFAGIPAIMVSGSGKDLLTTALAPIAQPSAMTMLP